MNQNKQFELRYPRLRLEALLKALLAGLTVGLAVGFVAAIALWFSGTESIGAVIGIFVGATLGTCLVAAVIFYFAKFRPTLVSNARRIDSLGLEERIVTMLEYQDDNSLIAELQRKDAMEALDKVDAKSIKFRFRKKSFVALAVCAALAFSMNVVALLSALGLLPSGNEIIEAVLPEDPPIYVPVSYIAEDGGYIDGELEQLVLFGENAIEVTAVAEDGFSFEGWDDGYKKPTRNDKKVDHPLVLTAIFLPLEEDDDGSQDGDGEPSEEGDQPGEEEGDSGEPGDQEGEDGDPSDKENGTGKYEEVNQIINNETYYREVIDGFRDKMMELLQKNENELTEEEKALIEAYINIV